MKTIEVYDWIAKELKEKDLTVEDLLDFYNEHNDDLKEVEKCYKN